MAEHRAALDRAITGAIGDLGRAALHWRSPLAGDGHREYRDAEFLSRVGQERLSGALTKLWPRRGPVWEGLAVVRRPGRPDGVLLVEAKAHPDEIEKGPGSAATAPDSTFAIKPALDWLAADLGLLAADTERWMRGPGYQYASRLRTRAG